MSTVQMPKVMLLTLAEKTSAEGNVYLSGWLGKARVVGFRGENDEHGNMMWNVYVQKPERRDNAQPLASDRPAKPRAVTQAA